jgi:hypothetical protein
MANSPSEAPHRNSSLSNAAHSRMSKCLGFMHTRSESMRLGDSKTTRDLAPRPGDALLHSVYGDTMVVELCIKLVPVTPQIVFPQVIQHRLW